MGHASEQEQLNKDKRRKKRATKSRGKWGNGFSFINIDLDRYDKEQIRGTELDTEAFLVYLGEWSSSGYKFSVKEDKKGAGIMVSLSGTEETCLNYQKVLTARAGTVEKAVLVLIYKLEELLTDVWLSSQDGTDDFMA